MVVSGAFMTSPSDERWTINESFAIASPAHDSGDPLDAWFVNAVISSGFSGGVCIGGTNAGLACTTFGIPMGCPGGVCGISITVQSVCLDLTP